MKVVAFAQNFDHSFELVSACNWRKYETHNYIRETDVMDRYIDENGRLFTRRLLTARGSLPGIFQRVIKARHLFILEESLVDPKEGTMTITAVNITLTKYFKAHGTSIYHRAGHSQTMYETEMKVTAAHPTYFGHLLESWVAPRLAGNSRRTKEVIDRICEKIHKAQIEREKSQDQMQCSP